MARIIDTRINAQAREDIADLYQDLSLTRREIDALAPELGVQPKTLEGWIEGRGSPVPKAAEGSFVLTGDLAETWSNRVILAQLLASEIESRGATPNERRGVYRDDVGEQPLDVILDRAKAYIARDTGDPWYDVQWRSLQIRKTSGGYILRVEYSRDYDEDF